VDPVTESRTERINTVVARTAAAGRRSTDWLFLRTTYGMRAADFSWTPLSAYSINGQLSISTDFMRRIIALAVNFYNQCSVYMALMISRPKYLGITF